MPASLKTFLADENGATAIEYGLLVAAIGVAVSVALITIGDDLGAKFAAVAAGFPD